MKNIKFIAIPLLLIAFFTHCSQDVEQTNKIKSLENTTALLGVGVLNSNRITTSTNTVEIEGKVEVVTDAGVVIPLFAGVEENIKGAVWSADYKDVAFPTGSPKTGGYYSQIIEHDNTRNYMITRRGRVCYGQYSDLTNLQTNGTTLKKFNSCISGTVSDDAVTTTAAATFSAAKCTNSVFCGFSSTDFRAQDLSVANDDTKVRQSWTDVGYFVSSWSELNSLNITYLCLMGPFTSYKTARDFVAGTNFISVSGSSTKCKDASGREAAPTTFDSNTNRFGYAPFTLKITK